VFRHGSRKSIIVAYQTVLRARYLWLELLKPLPISHTSLLAEINL